MSSTSKEINNLYESLKIQALEKNDKSVVNWCNYRNDLEVTKSLLTLLPKKVTHNIMVPIGPKALMHGKIVHTNEFLVNLGETWFVKRTAHQTIEICDRRIKTCAEMLEKLEKERNLIVHKSTLPLEKEAFGNEERPEIIEYVTEEEHKKWEEQHKIREKHYRQKLAELRNTEKKPIKTVEDLWKHLDELELQEELEDELNRLNAGCSSEEDSSEEIAESDSLLKKDKQNLEDVKEENFFSKSSNTSSSNMKRKVSFVCDLDSSDDEPLRLEIKHSKLKFIPGNSNTEKINSPADIFYQYTKLINKKPLSVLKRSVNFSEENNLSLIKSTEICEGYDDDDEDDEENLEDNSAVSSGVYLHDIFERCIPNVNNIPQVIESKNKKISQFKALRKKQ